MSSKRSGRSVPAGKWLGLGRQLRSGSRKQQVRPAIEGLVRRCDLTGASGPVVTEWRLALDLDTGKPHSDNPGYSGQAWARNADLYEAIRTMPFNAELAAGSLSEERFRHYITQDA